MKEYPSIPKISSELIGLSCMAQMKYDGSNLRTEYSKKQGWYKWGTRRRLFDRKDPEYGIAIEIFEKTYAEPLAKAITDCKEFRGQQSAVAFLEFFGPESFAGWHDPKLLGVEKNEPLELRLFDVNIHRKGLLGPRRFIQLFGHLPTPQILYDGILTEQFVQDVREGRYPVNEGVICKGGGEKSCHDIWMVKIKTFAYLDKLKKRFGDEWQKYAE